MDFYSNFCLSDMRHIDYQMNDYTLDIDRLMSDLQKCIAFTEEPYLFYVKSTDGKRMTLNKYDEKAMKAILKKMVVGKDVNPKTGKSEPTDLWAIFNRGYGPNQLKNRLCYKSVRFNSGGAGVLDIFQGYPYEFNLIKYDEEILPFVDFIRDIICNHDENLFSYVVKWIRNLLEYPGKKNGTALLLTGEQGTGKNVFTNTICKLFGSYANKNVTSLDNIVGKFNGSLEDKILVVCNELQSVDLNKYLNADSLKSVITDKKIEINHKFMPVRLADNVCNLIMVSNNWRPIKIEEKDRRYVVLRVSSERRQDNSFFEKLCNSMKSQTFFPKLHDYFLSIEGEFNPRQIPMTEEKARIVEASKENWKLFFEDQIQWFWNGILTDEAYRQYQTYCKNNGHTGVLNKIRFGGALREVCDKPRVQKDGERNYYYIIKNECRKEYEELYKEKSQE